MTFALLRRITLCGIVLVAACGDDDDDSSSTKGGSCTTPKACFYVASPADYDVKTECTALGNSWSASACPTAGYARKCTQVAKVSVNNGPQQDVTYVYYFKADDTTTCLGTEEKLL